MLTGRTVNRKQVLDVLALLGSVAVIAACVP
jgi:hypothetical protein